MLDNDEFKKLEYLACFVGAASNNIPQGIRIAGGLLWFTSLTIHFSYDYYEATRIYGWTFLAAQLVWFLSLLATTWGTAYKALPWLTDGHKELEREFCYENTLQKASKLLRIFPYVAICFGFVASSIQHVLLHVDGALQMDFGQNSTAASNTVLQIIRFASGTHVYAGCALFWIIPTSIMLMTGYSMAEFMDQMSQKMKDKQRILAFKEAISSYSKRAKFVKSSSNKTFVVLTTLMVVGVLCFSLNAYIFLFGKRNYLHVWHSLLPIVLMIYPLCTAAWVTKQYTWFIITVVRAWVHRDDLDEASEEQVDEEQKKNGSVPNIKKRFWQSIHRKNITDKNSQKLSVLSEVGSLPPWQQQAKSVVNTGETNSFANAVSAINVANKFVKLTKQPRFNFEKFLTYLESMRSVVGFHIAGIMVTWDLVSTTLFLLFSVVAVFMQESIFGSQKSTLSQ